MKNFMKMTLASILGLLIFSVISVFLMFAVVGAIAAAGDKQPVMPQSAVLKIDMSTFRAVRSASRMPRQTLLLLLQETPQSAHSASTMQSRQSTLQQKILQSNSSI